MYKSIIRPCLFRIDAEKIHDQIITLLHIYRHLGPIRNLTRSLFHPKAVPFQWQNLNFSNRVGLSAGFDKEASCFDELSDLGFGFIEVERLLLTKSMEILLHVYSGYLKTMLSFHVPDSTIPEKKWYYRI